ncbi:MAG: EamA family transporter [Lachnospiraceae bacterium]|nr:EamA family transporter [Lachnospiraceae bacterium]
MKHKGVTLKNIILLQAIIIIYTVSSVMAKFASANKETPIKFFLFLGLEFAILAVYAVLWQQMIKRFDLSVAYANRSMAILWSMIWAVIFFHDKITLRNVLGVLLVLLGTIVVNMDAAGGEQHD